MIVITNAEHQFFYKAKLCYLKLSCILAWSSGSSLSSLSILNSSRIRSWGRFYESVSAVNLQTKPT
jgi:hypothetical protein